MTTLPEGTEIAHTRWGEPHSITAPAAAAPGSQPVPDPTWSPDTLPPGIELAPPRILRNPRKPVDHSDRTKKCRANDDTCNGWRISGSEFCAGHAGVLIPGGGREPQ